MSHLVIVGGSTGIGRDIQPSLESCGHTITVLRRGVAPHREMDLIQRAKATIDAVLLCQRYRGAITDEWQTEIDTSLLRSRQVIEASGAKLANASVVVMASVAGVSVEEEQPVSYHACKAALIEMVKYYAVVLGPKQIRVNAIIPGLTIKPEARAFYDSQPELEALYRDITPLGRLGTVEDIAHLVDFLIGEKSSYLTGQTITLDGGIGLRSQWSLARRVTPSLRAVSVTQPRKPAHV